MKIKGLVNLLILKKIRVKRSKKYNFQLNYDINLKNYITNLL